MITMIQINCTYLQIQLTMRGQESPTLDDLLSVTVFKRDFAQIQFLGVDSVWVVINGTHKHGTIICMIPIHYWREYVIGVNTLLA